MQNEKMMPFSLFQRYGTIAFYLDHMLALIHWGRPKLDLEGQIIGWEPPFSEICLSLWLLSVPEIYRSKVSEIAESVFSDFLYEHATETVRVSFIHTLRSRILASL